MKKGDFILIELEGKDDKGYVFDSTKGSIAKKLYGKESPLLIILGLTPLLKGIEEELYSMKEGEEKKILVPPEKAFGFRRKENVVVVPLSNFKKMPHKGDVISIESEGIVRVGVVASINSGRVLVDTNHPLSGKTVLFNIKIVKKLSTDEEKAEALLRENVKDFSVSNGIARIKDNLKPEEKEALSSLLKRYNLNIKLEYED